MLLRCLVQAYSKSATSARSEKERMLSAAIDLMHVLSIVAKALAKLPAVRGHQGVNAGMTFTVLRGVEPFIDGDPERMLILERLHQLAKGAKRLEHVSTDLVPASHRLAALALRFEATT
jgi:hypothetical protein